MDAFKIYRINGWLYFLGLPALAFFMGGKSGIAGLIKLLFVTSLLLAYAFSLNNFFDQKMEKRKIIFPCIPLMLLVPFAFFLRFTHMIIVVVFILLATFYSLPRVRLKSVPVVCSLTNATLFSLLFMLGIRRFAFEEFLFLSVLFLGLLAAQFIHELSHQKDDAMEKITTTAVWLGENKAKFLSSASLSVVCFLSVFLNKFIFAPLFLCSVYFIFSIWRRPPAEVRRESRIYGLTVGCLILIYLLTRN